MMFPATPVFPASWRNYGQTTTAGQQLTGAAKTGEKRGIIGPHHIKKYNSGPAGRLTPMESSVARRDTRRQRHRIHFIRIKPLAFWPGQSAN
jgi:hypothetical protein